MTQLKLNNTWRKHFQWGCTYKIGFTYGTISSCANVRCNPGHYLTPLLILHDQGLTSSRFHSSSVERLCFKQELDGHIIAGGRCDLLWGKLRLIMMKCSGCLCVLGSDFVFRTVGIGFTEWWARWKLCDLCRHLANTADSCSCRKSLFCWYITRWKGNTQDLFLWTAQHG